MSNIVKFRTYPATNFFPNSLIDDLFNRGISDFLGSDTLANQPAVNIRETNDGFFLQLAAPGYEKTDFTLNVENNTLTVSAQREEKTNSADERYTRREFRYESFKRSFKLPLTVNQGAVSAVYENGILNVKLPKNEEAKSIVKTISVA